MNQNERGGEDSTAQPDYQAPEGGGPADVSDLTRGGEDSTAQPGHKPGSDSTATGAVGDPVPPLAVPLPDEDQKPATADNPPAP